jgi:uncharacterized protein
MYCIQKKLKLTKALLIGIFFFTSCGPEVDEAYRQAISAERMEMNEHFFNPAESPLDSAYFPDFKGLKFFPINEEYKVKATLTLIDNSDIFDLPHSHDRTRPYKNYAKISFELKGKNYELMVLEQAEKKPGNENYLLLPFTDETNDKTTYGAGRYIDLEKGESKEIILDFNKAYNPYCAYNSKYTCPIPPKENRLPIAIEAGVKYEPLGFH